MLTSLYIEGDTVFHRLSVRVKLASLLLLSLVLFAVPSLRVLVPALVLTAGLYATTGVSLRDGFARIGFVFFTILFLGVVNLFLLPPLEVLVVVVRLMTLVLFAATVTATTTINAFMDEITVLLTPLERIGLVRAADVSLALGLVLRFVPEIFGRYQAIREAHQARGLPLRPMTIIGPLIILTLKDADMIALAIDARGFRRH